MSGELTFRPAGPQDVEAVVALAQAAYRGDASRVGWTTEADLLEGQRIDADMVRALVGAPGAIIILAMDGTQLMACCHLQRQSPWAEFGLFAVRPDAQGTGIGARVLAHAEDFAQQRWECRGMRMLVISLRTELICWYVRHGYRRSGEYTPFPYGDERYGMPRRDDLRFEMLFKNFPG